MTRTTLWYRPVPLDDMPMCTGRNGSVRTTGMQVFTLEQPSVVVLQPMTSKKMAAKQCDFEIPNERATLQAMADLFHELALKAPL